jgi:hypothetical protein
LQNVVGSVQVASVVYGKMVWHEDRVDFEDKWSGSVNVDGKTPAPAYDYYLPVRKVQTLLFIAMYGHHSRHSFADCAPFRTTWCQSIVVHGLGTQERLYLQHFGHGGSQASAAHKQRHSDDTDGKEASSNQHLYSSAE